MPKINTHSLPWPNQGAENVHNLTEDGLSEKNILPKQRSSKSIKLRKGKVFAPFPPRERLFCQNRWRRDRASEEFLGVFVFLYFYVCEFIFFLIENPGDWSWHCQGFLMGETYVSCPLGIWLQQPRGSQFKSLHQSLLAIVGTLLEVEKKRCPFEARLWTLHELLGIM